MKLLILSILFLASTGECGKRFNIAKKERSNKTSKSVEARSGTCINVIIYKLLLLNQIETLCEGDDACMQQGISCFKTLKAVYSYYDEQNPDHVFTRKEKVKACLEENNVIEEYEAFVPRNGMINSHVDKFIIDSHKKESGTTESTPKKPMNKETIDRIKSKRKLIGFVKSLEKSNPDTGLSLRCCLMNNLKVFDNGVLNEETLKNLFTKSLTDPLQQRNRDVFINAIDSCPAPTDCQVNAYVQCLVHQCVKS